MTCVENTEKNQIKHWEKTQITNRRFYTEAKALPKDASWRHIFLRFNLGEVERAGKDENIYKVDEALQESDWSLNCQALGWFNILQFMLLREKNKVETAHLSHKKLESKKEIHK